MCGCNGAQLETSDCLPVVMRRNTHSSDGIAANGHGFLDRGGSWHFVAAVLILLLACGILDILGVRMSFEEGHANPNAQCMVYHTQGVGMRRL